MAVTKMKIDPMAFQIDSRGTPLKKDAAVLTLKQHGFQEEDILPVAMFLKEKGQNLSAYTLFIALEKKGILPNLVQASNKTKKDDSKSEEILDTLKQQNSALRSQTVCKVCMDKEVAVVFLPCGHLVCCTDCAPALKLCPMCRQQVKGIVRAFIGIN